jgi:hypothetical protein
MARISRRPSPATVIACIALFVSLGGVGYAAATGSIDSRELKNNSIRSKDIRNGNVTSTDVKNSSVRGGDVRNNSLTGSDVNEGSLGKVPSAAAADAATNAGTLDGKDSTEFGPRAFARINGGAATGGDTVNDALSQGIADANVVHPQPGVYCFVNLGFTPRNLVATIDVNDSPGGAGNIDTIYTHTTGFGTCTGVVNETQAAVRTRNAGIAANRSFFVVFH